MENKLTNKEKEFRRTFIITLVNEYYFYPSRYNLFGRMCAYLSRQPTKKEYKIKLLKEEGLL